MSLSTCVSLWVMSIGWGVAPVSVAAPPPAIVALADGHNHPSKGPHGGMLLELGNHEYHAELVHDDKTDTITVYLLDGAIKNAVAIPAPEVFINVKKGDKPQQFKVKATPQESDPAGQASRFALKDPALGAALDDEQAEARLRVSIKGKSYTVRLAHEHAH